MPTSPSAPQYSKPIAASWSGSRMNSATVARSQIRHNSTQMMVAVLKAARSFTSHPCALRYRCLTAAGHLAWCPRMGP